ncbi:type II secretion system minor pseudopilin GspH [Halopseudomonas nanhaiensis]|uniref:type II secretion system minor pseudopilin GspH n=1 Tax=Halopseudomonas nanhaiensis TaxID=2830842 RepID=UPI001CBC75CB|nr:type II secretion system minor pseudopilin GspH [Halopseudomonas nanhaiensis]UAW97484.1 type II secretion system minor pseudopilin GspH [Halopseudomonas nanhaiensis]
MAQRRLPHSFKGFTLMELLVVLVLVGVVASLATLAVGDGAERQVRSEADRLANVLRLARDETMITGEAERALGLRRDGYSFLELVLLDDATREWRTVSDAQLGPHPIDQQLVELDLVVENKRLALPQTSGWEPHIRLSNTGEMTPAFITLRKPGSNIERQIEIGADGRIEVVDAQPEE